MRAVKSNVQNYPLSRNPLPYVYLTGIVLSMFEAACSPEQHSKSIYMYQQHKIT